MTVIRVVLVFIVVFSALASSLDSLLAATSDLVVNDLYKGHLRPRAGDEALLTSGCNAIILRVSWVYGMRGSNFLLTMRRLMAERDALEVVDDQIGAPTWCGTIAEVTTGVVQKALAAGDSVASLRGVYHLAPSGKTSWFGFATAIQDLFGLACELIPIPATEYPTPAKRPQSSRMDCSKLVDTFGIGVPGWHEALRECVYQA